MKRWGVLALAVALAGCEAPDADVADDVASTTAAVESTTPPSDGADMRAQFWHMCVYACAKEYGCVSNPSTCSGDTFVQCTQMCDVFYPSDAKVDEAPATAGVVDTEPTTSDASVTTVTLPAPVANMMSDTLGRHCFDNCEDNLDGGTRACCGPPVGTIGGGSIFACAGAAATQCANGVNHNYNSCLGWCDILSNSGGL